MEQGFTKPNRNAASWDSDLNANFTLIERGFVFPGVCGPVAINTGQWVTHNASGFVVPYDAKSVGMRPRGFAYQVTSPGNTGYFVRRGGVNSFSPYSGQLDLGAAFYPSVSSIGWVTSCLYNAGMHRLGFTGRQGEYVFDAEPQKPTRVTDIRCGFANTTLTFSFAFLYAGNKGIVEFFRIRSNSANNYSVRLFSNSGRTDVIYQSVVRSGQIAINTVDFQDNAMFPYYSTDTNSVFSIYGQIDVLSTAATTIDSDAFRIDATFLRDL